LHLFEVLLIIKLGILIDVGKAASISVCTNIKEERQVYHIVSDDWVSCKNVIDVEPSLFVELGKR
jgi:hypothetical protein